MRTRAAGRPEEVGAPSDAAILGRSAAIGVAGVLAVGLTVCWGRAVRHPGVLGHVPIPPLPAVEARAPLKAVAITDAMRRKGIHECNPPDPLGLGPYTPYRHVRQGQLTVPQKGGKTPDGGYDVIVHFHGHEAVRKTLVQVARGVAFVGIDKGVGSGPYAAAFQPPKAFENLRVSIEGGLKALSGDPRAHIRHLALTAWSAGYGAVNGILKHGDDGVDAVVLLDGLHAAWKPGAKHGPKASAASSSTIEPVFEFARRAAKGEKIFVFTHSEIDPVDYPSTRQTADLLLGDLGLERTPVSGQTRYPLTGRVDHNGLHVWSYRGRDQKAHCDHIRHIGPIVRDLLEPAWRTPAMDRDVPPTPAPVLGGARPSRRPQGAGSIHLGVVEGSGTAAASEPPSPSVPVDEGGLVPVPLEPPAVAPEG